MKSPRNLIFRRRPAAPGPMSEPLSEPCSVPMSRAVSRGAGTLRNTGDPVSRSKDSAHEAWTAADHAMAPLVPDVAAQTRLLSQGRIWDHDAEDLPPPATAAHQAQPRTRLMSGHRIWDLEKEVEPVADPMPPEPARSADPLILSRPVVRAAPQANHARTRLIGFHDADDDLDPFAADHEPAGQVVHFPIGWLVVVEGPGRGASFALGQGLSTIGRDPDQSVPLAFGDTTISRRQHVSVAYDADSNSVLVGHGGKANVVRLNGAPLLSTETLHNGDLLRIGSTTLRFIAFCGPDFSWDANADA